MFVKEFLEKVKFEKSADDKKIWKVTQNAKSVNFEW